MADAAEPSQTETTSRQPNPVLAVFGRALEAALNRLVDLDPETRTALQALDGRAITLTFRDTPLAMRIAVAGERLTIGPTFAGDSALRVAATPFALNSAPVSASLANLAWVMTSEVRRFRLPRGRRRRFDARRRASRELTNPVL